MSVYWDKDKKRWRFSFNRSIGGRKCRLTKLLPKGWSQREAEAYDRKESGGLYAQATGVSTERLKIEGAVHLYTKHRCPELRNGKKAIQDLAHLDSYYKGKFLDEADEVAAKYQLDMKGKLAPATIRNRLAYLRASVRYARKKHMYGRGQPDHTVGMDLPAPNNNREVYAKVPELEVLWNKFSAPEAAALFKLAFYLGLRWRAELLTRTKEHISKNGEDTWLTIGKTKNDEPVMKYVNPEAAPCLEYIPFEMSDSWFYDRWHEAVKKIHRPDLRPHDLRHSLGSDILSRPGASLADVAAGLHHKSLASAARYAHLYPDRAKSILAATGGQRKSAHSLKKLQKEKPRKAA